MTTKLGTVVTYDEELPRIKLLESRSIAKLRDKLKSL